MKYIIRDDIIHMDRYYIAEKNRQILENIYNAGYYVFLGQFKEHYSTKKYNILLENKLLDSKVIDGHNKMLFLTTTSMKYLLLRDSEINYSEKNKINVTRVNRNPSEKQLFSSAYKFELLMQGIEINKSKISNDFFNGYLESNGVDQKLLKDMISDIDNKRKKLDEFNKFSFELSLFLEKINSTNLNSEYDREIKAKMESVKDNIISNIEGLEKRVDLIHNSYTYKKTIELQEMVIDYYKQAKIIIKYKESKISVWIMDTGSDKTPWAYMNYFKKFKDRDMRYKSIDITIVSYSRNRAISLKERFEESLRLRDMSNQKMREWEKSKKLDRRYRREWKYEPPELYRRHEKVYYHFKDVENIDIYTGTHYLEKYKLFSATDNEFIKEKDRDALEEIRKYFT